MDYLQYVKNLLSSKSLFAILGFKPCYKWITFNTEKYKENQITTYQNSFKPCYKWITFNTQVIGTYVF